MIEVTVTYPAPVGRFDMDYYLNKHIPLVKEVWGNDGLIKVEVAKGIGGPAPGTSAGIDVIARLVFDNMDNLQNALPKAAAFAEDLKNFTDAEPKIQISEVVMSEAV